MTDAKKLNRSLQSAMLTGAEAISMLLSDRTKEEILIQLDLSEEQLREDAEILYREAD